MKCAKKLLSAILVAAMMLTAFAPSALAAPAATVSVGSAKGSPGGSVSVSVSVSGGAQIGSGSFNVVYDNTKLELTEVTQGSLLSGASAAINSAYAENKVRVSFATSGTFNGNGKLLTLKFKIKRGAEGTAALSVEAVKLGDGSDAAISAFTGNGSVKIVEAAPTATAAPTETASATSAPTATPTTAPTATPAVTPSASAPASAPELIVEPKDEGSGIGTEGIGNAIDIPELSDKNVDKVVVELVVDTSVEKNAPGSIAIVNNDGSSAAYNVLAAFDLSLLKTVYNADGTSKSETISDDAINGMITVRIPIPESLKGMENLTIVYIDDNGNVTEFVTKVVTVDGVQYLEFQTDHFSTYAIISKAPAAANLWWIWIVVVVVVLLAAIIIVLLVRRKKNAQYPEV